MLRKKTILFFIVLVFIVLGCKSQERIQEKDLAVDVKYWNLSTGSRIAYAKFISKDSTISVPLIFLHGGPGANQVKHSGMGQKWYKHLASMGFDVYVYDQIGSGLSSRLSNPAEYSVQRHIEDLEAIRKIIGKEKIILAGDSWGATLSSNYIARYPQHIIKAIFTSPGPIDPGEWNKKSDTPRLAPEYLNWINEKYGIEKYNHYLKIDYLLQSNLDSAYKYAGDAEMDILSDDFLNDVIMNTTVHDPDILKEKNFAMEGTGWWVMTMTIWDASNNKSMARNILSKNKIPVLILRGDADYLPIEIANEYSMVFSNSKYVKIAKAGHLIWLEKPEIFKNEIESFLINKN